MTGNKRKNKDLDFEISPRSDKSTRFDYSINNSFNNADISRLNTILKSVELELKSLNEKVQYIKTKVGRNG